MPTFNTFYISAADTIWSLKATKNHPEQQRLQYESFCRVQQPERCRANIKAELEGRAGEVTLTFTWSMLGKEASNRRSVKRNKKERRQRIKTPQWDHKQRSSRKGAKGGRCDVEGQVGVTQRWEGMSESSNWSKGLESSLYQKLMAACDIPHRNPALKLITFIPPKEIIYN